MTCQLEAPRGARLDGPVPVSVIAAGPVTGAGIVAALRHHPGIELAEDGWHEPAVVVAVANTADDAVRLARRRFRPGGHRLVLVVDTLSPHGVLNAVSAGACAIVRRVDATHGRLTTVILSVATGDGTMPRELVGRLIEQADKPLPPPAPSAGLTHRELRVLQLVADGYGNADIASLLACSQHTVKNVIYDLMARLQLRNRAHAAAYAVRAGLI